MTLYQISDDLKALQNLVESLVDEDGEPREPTEEEAKIILGWFDNSETELQTKFDNYCRFIKNINLSAKHADSERKLYKAELDRLSRRAKAFENTAKRVQDCLWRNFQKLGIKKFKTDLFSAGEQNTALSVSVQSTADLSAVPDEYLKPREIDATAIKAALKTGELVQKEGIENRGKIFTREGDEIKGVLALTGTTFVIR